MTGGVLEFDVGNTALKWRYRQDGELSSGRQSSDEASILALFQRLQPACLRVSSVASDAQNAVIQRCAERELLPCSFAVTTARFGNIENAYEQPSLMGVDRWLAMIAAARQFSGNLLVVDIGTALTVDVVRADGRHLGGYIFPGRRLMRESLLGGTGRIRYNSDEAPDTAFGKSTAECVENGAWLAMVSSIEAAWRRAEALLEGSVSVVLTGGDAPMLITLARQPSWVYAADLVLDGLTVVFESEGGAL